MTAYIGVTTALWLLLGVTAFRGTPAAVSLLCFGLAAWGLALLVL